MISPNEFVDVATRLSGSTFEADLRTSISRAYYGAYHEAVGIVRKAGVSPPKSDASIHTKVRHILESTNAPDAVKAAAYLDTLRAARNDADYKIDGEASVSHAKRSEASAKKVQKLLLNCSSRAVLAAIKSYAQVTLRWTVS